MGVKTEISFNNLGGVGMIIIEFERALFGIILVFLIGLGSYLYFKAD